ncbi:malto-oligosyltrehalose synthase [Streptomyces sp. NPDC006879]|uniref:malto-oligosyltrehalose synthase n=1 Tax=Streptomyces sp. NPDC006879 TaxID=3364767 RepID=UPI0036BD25D1
MTQEPARKIPTATYRLQIQPRFPFAAAERSVPYLADLGVSHLHLSPALEAAAGSSHGYDVVDHGKVREELGGEDGLRSLADRARSHGMGLVLDIVPNHMAVPTPLRLNRALWDVLKHGEVSPYSRWFDIDWAAGGGRLLLPVLADRLTKELPRLHVEANDGEAVLRYGTQEFPLRAGTSGLPLRELVDAQWYRLAWWRTARTELNYRRFFTISELIGLRVEDPEVFRSTHRKVLELLHDGVLDGLRIDHPDGLADPEAYLRTLHTASGGAWTVVEKILATDEVLPPQWPVAGTTGYDALYRIDGLFTDPQGITEITDHYREFTAAEEARGSNWRATAARAAQEVAQHDLAAEIGALVRMARAIDDARGQHADAGGPHCAELPRALRAVLQAMPVYRPYGTGGATESAAGTAAVETAARQALDERVSAGTTPDSGAATPDFTRAVEFVKDLVLGRCGSGSKQRAFRTRFAQVSSALRAKSLEDRAFYRYAPLLSATEVGGAPGAPAVSPPQFHAYCDHLVRHWPLGGTVLSTHDTKRSGDVRARIRVLSQCPGRWRELVAKASAHTAAQAPDAHLAWVAWQTLFGLGAQDEEGRVAGALLKAAREAALHTDWLDPQEGYERALQRFAAVGLGGPAAALVEELSAELAPHTEADVLGATLVHLTMPGVPEIYQDTESEYLALVDPDNRSPARLCTGEQVTAGLGTRKLALTRQVLRLRRARPEAFGAGPGSYLPLSAEGPSAEHCVAYARGERVVTVVTRLSLRLAESGGWRDTRLSLPAGRWRKVFPASDRLWGQDRLTLADLLTDGPVALLVRVDG